MGILRWTGAVSRSDVPDSSHDPTGDAASGIEPPVKPPVISGVRPMRAERLMALAAGGAKLTPEEIAWVDEYRKMLAWD